PTQCAALACAPHTPHTAQRVVVKHAGAAPPPPPHAAPRLEKKGLPHRKPPRRDARMYAVRLTAKGQSALGAVKPVASRVDQRILSALKTDQRGDFIEALGEIVKSLHS